MTCKHGDEVSLTLPGSRTTTIVSRCCALSESSIEIGVRPEHLHLGPNGAEAAFDGEVRIVEQLGNSTLVYVDTPAGQLIVEGEGNLDVTPNEKVGVMLDARHAHLFGSNEQVV